MYRLSSRSWISQLYYPFDVSAELVNAHLQNDSRVCHHFPLTSKTFIFRNNAYKEGSQI